jgi:hypothetical protein
LTPLRAERTALAAKAALSLPLLLLLLVVVVELLVVELLLLSLGA